MDPQLLQALRVWYHRHLIAHENSTLLCQDLAGADNCNRVSALCSSRMEKYHKICEVVDSFKGSPDVLPQMQALWDAADDNGCDACHLSASGPRHPECKKKMEHYWQAHKDLIEWLAQDALDNTEASQLAALKAEQLDLRNIIHYLYTHKDFEDFAFQRLTHSNQKLLLKVLSDYNLDKESARLAKHIKD